MLLLRLKNIYTSCFWLLLTFLLVAGGANVAKGQYTKTYAQYVGPFPANTLATPGAGGTAGALGGPGSPGTASVVNTANINDSDPLTFAELRTQSGGVGGGLGGGAGGVSSAYINLNFSGSPSPITGTPILIKLTADQSDKVQIQAYSGGSAIPGAQNVSTLALTASNEYVFIAPASADAIRITATTGTGTLLGGVSINNVKVYHAYLFDPTCSPPNYTTTSITTLLDLGSGFTTIPDAIDGNLSTFSKFSAGLGVGTTLHQYIYFSKLSGAQDAATVTLSIPTSALAVGVASNIMIRAYNGSTEVGQTAFGGLLLGTDLLTLINSGLPATISFAPGAAFDRIEVSLTSLVALATSLNLYEVQVTPAKPTFSSPATQNIAICLGSPAVLTAVAPSAGNELRWYTTVTGGSPVFTGTSFSPTPAPTVSTTYYVASAKTGCSAESERIPAVVTVNPLPTVAAITGTTSLCTGGSTTLSNTTAGGVWGTSDPSKATVSSGGLVTGVAAGTATITYTITDANGCSNIASALVTINLQPALPPITSRSICLGQTVNLNSLNPADINGSTGGNYVWSTTAGGSVLPSTTVTPALGNTTYYVRYTINGCFSDSSVLVVVHPKPPTPHVTLN